MTSTYNKIHRIKQLGWSWERILGHIQDITPAGLDEKTVYALYRHPHRKPTQHVAGVIDRLHEQLFPDPFPEDINGLMRVYNHLQACRKHPDPEQDAADLERYVEGQYRRKLDDQPLRRARLAWLLGNIAFDRIPALRDTVRRDALLATRQAATDWYQRAIDHMTEHNRDHPGHTLGAVHLYKARQNILACYLNSVRQENRYQDRDLLDYVAGSDYLQNSRDTLIAEPFQWVVARNALRFASLLQRAEDVRFFFTALVRAARQFSDLAYEPLNTAAIAGSSDFAWAVENVLTPAYRQTVVEQEDADENP